jgi:N6-adenosine-specific RNA methylase IME4
MIAPLPEGPFATILADPPWKFRCYGPHNNQKSPEKHYDTMTLEDICALPVADIAAKDAFLILWTTWPCLPQALKVIESWGFTYKTGGAWGKLSKTGRKIAFGTGYIFRSASEPLIVASRGKPKWTSKSERNLWLSPVREHSRKPDCVHEMIERACPGPKVELFARAERPGWTVWGNETEKFVEAA